MKAVSLYLANYITFETRFVTLSLCDPVTFSS